MEVVAALDLHLKNTQGVVMNAGGEILREAKFPTTKEGLKAFLDGLPKGTDVALESLGFCWPWIDAIEELGFRPRLANPQKVKSRAEDVKTDKVDAELLAHLLRMDWLPTCYVPSREMRSLRSLLRHRAALRKLATAVKNRSWGELRKHGLSPKLDLSTMKGRTLVKGLDILELQQNMEVLEAIERQKKQVERLLFQSRFARARPVKMLLTIPGIGLVTALTIYAEICDIKRFSNPDKLAHYCGLVPRVHQSGGSLWTGREVRQANKWLKWILVEASWSHIRNCPEGRLAKAFASAYRRKRSRTKAIKITARKFVNLIWAVWTYEEEFRR